MPKSSDHPTTARTSRKVNSSARKQNRGDDSQLLAACGRLIAEQRRWRSVLFIHDEDLTEDAYDRVYSLVEQVAAMRPTTLAGYQAKAMAAFSLWAAGGPALPDDDDTAVLVRALVMDLTAGVGGGTRPAPA
jgi:hypothetical protein